MRHLSRCAALLALGTITAPACQADSTDPLVRPAECADDMWYPRDGKVLAKRIDQYLDQANPPAMPTKPAALISPHAGIRWSGPVAAAAYKTLKGRQYKRVIVLGFSHRNRFSGGAILPKVTAYGTPLGNIPLDRKACDELLANKEFAAHQDIHRGEHSLEIQLPFLQRVLTDFQLVPIMVGELDLPAYDRMAQAIARFVDDDTLVVASSDFTHYGRRFLFVPFTENIPENLKRIDFSSAEPIMALDVPGFLAKLKENGVGNQKYRRPQTICGRSTITLLMTLLNRVAAYKGIRLAYDASGRMTNDWQNSVSYMAIGFVKTGKKADGDGNGESTVKTGKKAQSDGNGEPTLDTGSLTPEERKVLLQIARDAATRALNGKGRLNPRMPKYKLTPSLEGKGGAFVTLRNQRRLRGCIGTIIARGPLVDSVVDNAVSAATRDYRFAGNPVTAGEMGDITIEISALSPPRRVDGPDDIVLGKHGVILSRGLRYRSVYLPQVATETGWDIETFLSRLSRKAGLPMDAWKKPGTRFDVFSAEVFGEPEKSHAAK